MVAQRLAYGGGRCRGDGGGSCCEHDGVLPGAAVPDHHGAGQRRHPDVAGQYCAGWRLFGRQLAGWDGNPGFGRQGAGYRGWVGDRGGQQRRRRVGGCGVWVYSGCGSRGVAVGGGRVRVGGRLSLRGDLAGDQRRRVGAGWQHGFVCLPHRLRLPRHSGHDPDRCGVAHGPGHVGGCGGGDAAGGGWAAVGWRRLGHGGQRHRQRRCHRGDRRHAFLGQPGLGRGGAGRGRGRRTVRRRPCASLVRLARSCCTW